MDHVAIMKKSWGLTEKILKGEKRVESRWYKTKRTPWNQIKKGDRVYFKDSGGPVSIKARTAKVVQLGNLTGQKKKQILHKYGKTDLGAAQIMSEMKEYVADKNYCILVFLEGIEKIRPFDINKKGFGNMAAWISIDDINKIKKTSRR